MDWDIVDDDLYVLPAVYKDARFDSLKHVLTVLGAVDSEAALDEVGNFSCTSRAPAWRWKHLRIGKQIGSHCVRGSAAWLADADAVAVVSCSSAAREGVSH